MFNDEITTTLTDIKRLKFLDYEEEGVELQTNTQAINGVDGVLLGPSTFGPFNLVLNFSFKGVDNKDYKLVKQKLRGLLFRREPFYIWHSDEPGKKYAVYCEENAIEDLTSYFGTLAIKFTVYKGYSESLRDTNDLELLQEDVQFEQGLELAEKLQYKHKTRNFKIYNGSTDVIDPLMRHKLIVKLSAEAPNGFKIRNKTTKDVFEYKKKLK